MENTDFEEKGSVVIYAKYHFSEDEKKEIAQELTEKIQEKNRAEGELKSLKSDFKSKIDEIDSRIICLVQNHRNGYEYRNMKCMLRFNFDSKKREYLRIDTGELVKTEDLQEDDYQRPLDFVN